MSVFDEFLDIFGFGDSETPDIHGGPKYNKPKSDKRILSKIRTVYRRWA